MEDILPKFSLPYPCAPLVECLGGPYACETLSLRATCRAFRAGIPSPPRIGVRAMLRIAAQSGNLAMIESAFDVAYKIERNFIRSAYFSRAKEEVFHLQLFAYVFAIYHAARGGHAQLCDILISRARAYVNVDYIRSISESRLCTQEFPGQFRLFWLSSMTDTLLGYVICGAARSGHTCIFEENMRRLFERFKPTHGEFSHRVYFDEHTLQIIMKVTYKASRGNHENILSIAPIIDDLEYDEMMAKGAARGGHFESFRYLTYNLRHYHDKLGLLQCAIKGKNDAIICAIIDSFGSDETLREPALRAISDAKCSGAVFDYFIARAES